MRNRNVKMKAILFTVVLVVPLAYLFKVVFPETSRFGGFLVILGLIVIFHFLGRFIFSRREQGIDE